MSLYKIGLIMTKYLRLIAEDFDYSRYDGCSHLREIVRLIQQWVLQPHEGIEEVDVSRVEDHRFELHPVPAGSVRKGLVEVWRDEVGRILCAHDDCCSRNAFFVGVACDSAFSGGEQGQYSNPLGARTLPLVGPNTLEDLSDAYEWDTPHDVRRMQVTVSDFLKNFRYIGAIRIRPPSGGSHCIAEFAGTRSWPLDTNYDPILREHLRTLCSAAGYPVHVVRDALVNGRYPRKVCRLRRYQT